MEITNKTIEITIEDQYSKDKNGVELTTYTTPSGKKLEALKKGEDVYIKVSSLSYNYDVIGEFYEVIKENKKDSIVLNGITYINIKPIEKFLE